MKKYFILVLILLVMGGCGGFPAEETEDSLKKSVMKASGYTIRNSIYEDFNGDGEKELVALMIDTGGKEQDCVAYRWYTDGDNTYCYSQSEHWWLYEDTFYAILTDAGLHLAETIMERMASDVYSGSIVKFTDNEAIMLFKKDHYYFYNPEQNKIQFDELIFKAHYS